MSKPQGTYLQSRVLDKIAANVNDTRALKLKVDQERRAALGAAFKRARIDAKNLDTMRKIGESCKNLGKEPTTRQGVLLDALRKVLKQLTEFAEAQAKFKELANETGQPSKALLGATRSLHGGTPPPASVAAGALAVVVFVMALKKALSRIGAWTRGSSGRTWSCGPAAVVAEPRASVVPGSDRASIIGRCKAFTSPPICTVVAAMPC